MIRVGVIGYGYWGPNLVRNFTEAPGSEVLSVSDLRPDRLALAKKRYPSIQTTEDYRDLLSDARIDAVAISTPVSTHFEIGMQALKAGKHLLVEKPLASNSLDALRLIEEADRRNRILMVDHTFVYTPAVRKIRDLVQGGVLGQLYYFDSVRINLGLFQQDVDVIWDLAVHDLSIMNYVIPARPCAVSATGMSHVAGKHENIAYITVFFQDRLIAHIHVNWLAPVKVRQTLIGGSKKMIVYDDLEPSEKIKVYDRGLGINHDPESLYKVWLSYRTGDMWAPQLDRTEALTSEALHFIDCIENGATPTTGGEAGLEVVRILEAATQSMKARGRLVEFEKGAAA